MILLAIVAVMSVLVPDRFLTTSNLFSISYQLPILAFLALGMMVTILAGGINLAIIATANFTGIVTVLLLRAMVGQVTYNAPLWVSLVALLGGLAAAVAVGLLMGYLVAYVKVPAFLATLAVMILLNGVNVVLTRGYTLSGLPMFFLDIGNGTLGPIPIPAIILVVVCVLLAILLNRTVFGTSIYLVGTNPTAAKYSNIRVESVLMRTYVLSAIFSALTAFIMMGQLNSVKANYAESYLLVAVLACFLGGVDPWGGAGKLSGVILATIVLQVVSTSVNLLRMDPFFVQAMWGIIVLVVLGANYVRALRAKAASRRSAVASSK